MEWEEKNMKLLATLLVFSGLNLMGLSGLEKVLIFVAHNGNVNQMQAIINLTPSYIWGITNITFGFGFLLVVIGLAVFFKK